MNALDKLGLAIVNAGYTWTPEMRQAYEEGIKELEAAVLAERELCAKVCEELEYYYEYPRATTTDSAHKPRSKTNVECASAIRARSNNAT